MNTCEGNRIGWLDSTRAPSRIHRTTDGGETTVCGHTPNKTCQEKHGNEPRWILDDSIPRKIHGRSRYCQVCFRDGGKTLPFIK